MSLPMRLSSSESRVGGGIGAGRRAVVVDGGGGRTLLRRPAPRADVTEGAAGRLELARDAEGALPAADEMTLPSPPRPFTRPAWAREANEADMLVGSEKPPRPKGL